jgi:hypothetical protein
VALRKTARVLNGHAARWILPALLFGLLGGSGGGCSRMSPSDETRSQLKTGRSLVEQGSLLAEFATQGDSISSYTRGECADLEKQAEKWIKETKKLPPETRLSEASKRIQRLREILSDLSASTDDLPAFAEKAKELSMLASEWPQ